MRNVLCKSSTLTLVKLRLDNHEVHKTSLSHAQYNRPNYSLMTMMMMMMMMMMKNEGYRV